MTIIELLSGLLKLKLTYLCLQNFWHYLPQILEGSLRLFAYIDLS